MAHWDAVSDGDLVRLITDQRGNAAEAEAELYGRFARRVQLYGIRHLGREEAAFDLAQDVMLMTIRKVRAGELRDPDRIASFVLGAARLMTKERRRGAARESGLDKDDAEKIPFKPQEPDRFAEDLLRRCLQALAERERAILLLTYYAEQSTAVIARSMGLEEGNVRVLRHRGMASLRDCIGVGRESVG